MSEDRKKPDERLSRRAFLDRATRSVGAAAALPLLGGAGAALAAGEKSRVVLVRHAAVIDAGGKVQAPLVRQMLTRAMVALTGKTDIREAWAPYIAAG